MRTRSWYYRSRLSAKNRELAPFADHCLVMKPIILGSAIVLTLMTAAGLQAHAQAPSAGQQPCSEPGDSSTTLSDKLNRGGGVICPPDVDPGMKAPAPDTGKMRVIPPPGSPGGDPKVQPK
jgi:hypothetical protein